MMHALARGWLLAWLTWSAVPVGSLVLILIHPVSYTHLTLPTKA